MTSVPDFRIEPLVAGHRDVWRSMWASHKDEFSNRVSEVATEITWQRLISDVEPLHGLAAMQGDDLIGVSHYAIHPVSWSIGFSCFLLDLYVLPEVRRRGLGRYLLRRTLAQARERGAGHVYWVAERSNVDARKFYDGFNLQTGAFDFYECPAGPLDGR